MKKTLLAAALALGFTGVAQAETSVTLYGLIDTGIGYTELENNARGGASADKTGLHDSVQSGNRWGLRGSEDLGNGLKAVFRLESGFSVNSGKHGQGDRLFGRHATLGLESDNWGALLFGRQTNIAAQFLSGVASPFGNSFGEANIGHSFTSLTENRADNVISYVTPSFSGFRFGAAYSFGFDGQRFDHDDLPASVSNPADKDEKLLSLGAVYANGPLAVGLAYDNLDADKWNPGIGGQTGSGDNVQSWVLAGSYDFEVVKLHLGFGQDRKGRISGLTNAGVVSGDKDNPGLAGSSGSYGKLNSAGYLHDDYKTNNYTVGLSAPLGGGRVMFAWQMSDLDDDTLGTYQAAEDTQHIYSLGYTYALSKRTNVYAVGTYGKGYGFDDVDVTQAVIGLRHQF